jgi:hypothetical protein
MSAVWCNNLSLACSSVGTFIIAIQSFRRYHRMRLSLSLIFIGCFLLPLPARCWWENGHRTVARIAAANLTPAARTRVSKLLGVPDTPEDVAEAMAKAATWADEIKKDRPDTAAWHYIDLTVQDPRTAFAERCAGDNCVTARIQLFKQQLSSPKQAADTPAFSDQDALRFLVHFLGDVEQPLHAISDADQGGNCEPLDPPMGKARNLHAFWDGYLPDALNPDDKLLAAQLNKEIEGFSDKRRDGMAAGNEQSWAWESHEIAVAAIYKRLQIPEEPAEFPTSCANAPEAITSDRLDLTPSYAEAMLPVVRLQLERGGLRLAKLLNDTL